MSPTAESTRRDRIAGLIGLAVIVAIVGGIGFFAWASYKTNPERRLAGVWVYDDASPTNQGGTGQGYQLEFAGKTINVFDGSKRKVLSYAWKDYRYTDGSGEFPLLLILKKTDNEMDGFAMVRLGPDDSRILFAIAGDGPSKESEFHRQ